MELSLLTVVNIHASTSLTNTCVHFFGIQYKSSKTQILRIFCTVVYSIVIYASIMELYFFNKISISMVMNFIKNYLYDI